MNQFAVSVLETKKVFSKPFSTHPMECGWAKEAMFFIRAEEIQGKNPELTAKVQLSMDGVDWIDEGRSIRPIESIGIYFCRVTHFGGWLRLQCNIKGSEAHFKVTIQLTLKG